MEQNSRQNWLHPDYQRPMRRMGVFLLLLALIQLFAWLLSTWLKSKDLPGYLPIHTLLETISIVVSMMVFAVGWSTGDRRIASNIILLCCVFFSVGVLDFLHTISYSGMPDFISPNNQQKQLNFWLFARTLAAVSLLWVAVRAWRPFKFRSTYYLLFISLIGMVSIIAWSIVYHQNWFADTFIPGVGLTPFKKNIEYIIILVNLVTAAVLWRKMQKVQPFNIVLLFGAVCTLAMSEFYFTLYTTMVGSYNMLGHIYKVVAYLLIYRAIVVEVIEEPYNLLKQNQQKLELLLRASNTGLWDWDLQTNHAFYSPEWKAQLGYLADELPDHYTTWESLLHQDDRESALGYLSKYLASSNDEYVSEFRLRHKDGSYRWTISRGKKQYDRHGKLTRLVGSQIDITERKNADIALLNLNHELSESRQHLREMASRNDAIREVEKKHIAREVHDELGQVLTALRMDLSLIRMRFSALDPSLNDKVSDMKLLVNRAIQGVRNVATNLRPVALDMGLVAAINWLCNEFTRKTKIACVIDVGCSNIELDEVRATVVFRIVQESLTNITRYANASKVQISFDFRCGEMLLEVRDNGCGFDCAAVDHKKSFGLLGMRERALALGGLLKIISIPNEGTMIVLSIPIDLDPNKENL